MAGWVGGYDRGMAGAAVARRATAGWRRARRNRWLDHLIRAGVRYDQADGGRLSAAITYYAYFAAFALTLLGLAVFGFVLDNPAVAHSVQRYLTQNLPRLDVRALREARGTVGIIAFVGLPVTGWFWVDALRSSIRRLWQLPEYPGALPVRVVVDLLVLAGLGLLLAASLTVAFLTTALAGRLVSTLGADAGPARWLLATVGFLAGHRGEHRAVHRGAHRATPAADAAAPRPRACPPRRPWASNCSKPSAGSTCNTPRPTPPTRSWPAPSDSWCSSTRSTSSSCSPPH